MKEEKLDKLNKLGKDILGLKNNLLEEVTKSIVLEKGDEGWELARQKRRRKVKELKNSLNEKITIWELIHKAEDIVKTL